MKQLLLILALCYMPLIIAQEYSGMTYNIRLDVESDDENAWVHRKEQFVNQIEFLTPVVFGIQEAVPSQMSYLSEQLSNYAFIGEGRNGGNKGEYSAIFYDKAKVRPLKQGTFWLSKSPKKVSKGWDAALPRICTYGLFEDKKNNLQFWVFNTHFDHMGEEARIKSAELILKMVKKLSKKNSIVLVMGDLNAEPDAEPVTILKENLMDSFDVALSKFGPEFTFNGFQFPSYTGPRIDYIFVSDSEDLVIKKHAVLNNSYNNKYISDHFPVYITFQIQK